MEMAMRAAVFCFLAFSACGLGGLTADDVLVRTTCPTTCPDGQVCAEHGQCVEEATLTGAVIDACNGAALAARVTIAGRSVCSGSEKVPYFSLVGLVPGGPYTLAVGKVGYRSYVVSRELLRGANTHPVVSLTPADGCQAPPPPAACVCADSL